MTKGQTASLVIKSLKDVHDYCDSNKENWESILDSLEYTLTAARDAKEVPIYLTKGRIKQPESAYLKFKRKSRNDPTQITDWIGFRVLCLFQQDLYDAFTYLFDLLTNKKDTSSKSKSKISHFELKEIIIFNWPEERANRLIESIKKSLGTTKATTLKTTPRGMDIAYTFKDNKNDEHVISFKVTKEARGTGYQSVHFVANAKCEKGISVSCEIQLRTLLQDVWGELEHALSYKKGKIHPHISNSFELLSTELHAKDELVSQLRDIRDQETALVRYSSKSSGPSRWLNYPDAILGNIPQDAKDALLTIESHCKNRSTCKSTDQWQNQATELLKTLEVALGKESDSTIYILSMEKALLAYSKGDLLEAQNIYEAVRSTEFGEKQWFPLFRLGAIYLAQEKIGQALVAFDQAEERMKDAIGGEIDRYYAKVGLAYSYWSLAKEFLPIAIKKMEDGGELIKEIVKNTEEEEPINEEKLSVIFSQANNLCFYYLEHWLNTPHSADVSEIHNRKHLAEKQFETLKALVLNHPGQTYSNYLDTLAWYCFQTAEQTKDDTQKTDWLRNAFEYVQRVEQTMNRSPSRVISNSIQREHMQQILSTCMRHIDI